MYINEVYNRRRKYLERFREWGITFLMNKALTGA